MRYCHLSASSKPDKFQVSIGKDRLNLSKDTVSFAKFDVLIKYLEYSMHFRNIPLSDFVLSTPGVALRY